MGRPGRRASNPSACCPSSTGPTPTAWTSSAGTCRPWPTPPPTCAGSSPCRPRRRRHRRRHRVPRGRRRRRAQPPCSSQLSADLRAACCPARCSSAIVLPPVVMEDINPNYWPGFPWAELAPYYDVWQPMGYWTLPPADSGWRDGYSLHRRQHRPRPRATSAGPTRRCTRSAASPTRSGPSRSTGMAQAAAERGALGGSLYDFRTIEANASARRDLGGPGRVQSVAPQRFESSAIDVIGRSSTKTPPASPLGQRRLAVGVAVGEGPADDHAVRRVRSRLVEPTVGDGARRRRRRRGGARPGCARRRTARGRRRRPRPRTA